MSDSVSPQSRHLPAISARLGAVVNRSSRMLGRGPSMRRFLKVLITCQVIGLITWAVVPALQDSDGIPVDTTRAGILLAGPAALTPPNLPGQTSTPESEQVQAPIASAPQQAPRTNHELPQATFLAPDLVTQERTPTDHPPVSRDQLVEVRVVTIRARVTAYTPYDHLRTKPEWADGIVAWHPNGRKRHVRDHRYGLATDWAQFPPGATFIRIPGYMERTFDGFPENFRVVDDGCGRSRVARRRGEQPVIDVRFMTRYSAIDPRGGWGSRQLDVEVIFPAGFAIPTSLRRWVVADETHRYYRGERVD